MINDTQKMRRPCFDKKPLPALLIAVMFGLPMISAQADEGDEPVVDFGTWVIHAKKTSAWQSPPGMVATRSASATKTDTQLTHTPASISVITQDQIKAQGVQSVAQALRYTPSVYSESRISPRYDSLFMRGFGGFGQTTNFIHHTNGHKLPRGLSYLVPNMDPALIERIDVVRGANSVIHGQVNPGGVVNQLTKRAHLGLKRHLSVQAGDNNMRMASFDVNTPLAWGNSAVRLNGIYRAGKSDTGIDYERYAVAPAFTWQPNDRTELMLHAWLQKDPKGGDYNALPAYGTIIQNPGGDVPKDTFLGDKAFERFERTFAQFGYQLTHRVNDEVALVHSLSYADGKSQFRNTSLRVYNAGNNSFSRIATASDERLDGINGDVQLRYRFGQRARHHLNVGVDYQGLHAERLLGNGATGAVSLADPRAGDHSTPMVNFATDSRRRQSQLGVYIQDQIELGNWLAQLGVRHDQVRTKDTITNLATGRIQQNAAKTDAKTTYQASLLYGADNGFSPYVSYATSFEPTTAANRFGPPFEPTTAKQWELGFKYQPDDKRVLFSGALFDLTRNNVLTKDVRIGADPSAQIQRGQVKVRGAELEARAEWTDAFSTIASATYLKPEVTQSNIASELGKVPVGVPQKMASVWGQYAMLDDHLKLSAGVRYVAGSYADAANTFKLDDTTLLDVGVRYDLEHVSPRLQGVSLGINAQNVTDKTHYSSCFSSTPTFNAMQTQCFAGAGRNVVVGVSYDW